MLSAIDYCSANVGCTRSSVLHDNETNHAGTTRMATANISDTPGPGLPECTDWLELDTYDTASGTSKATVESFVAPMHGQTTTDTNTTTARRLWTGAVTPAMTEERTKSNEGRAPSAPVRMRRATSKYTGHGNSIPSRCIVSNIEAVSTSALRSRRDSAVETNPCGFKEDCVRTGGVQATCGCPLVPRPSSPRSHAESHPW